MPLFLQTRGRKPRRASGLSFLTLPNFPMSVPRPQHHFTFLLEARDRRVALTVFPRFRSPT